MNLNSKSMKETCLETTSKISNFFFLAYLNKNSSSQNQSLVLKVQKDIHYIVASQK